MGTCAKTTVFTILFLHFQGPLEGIFATISVKQRVGAEGCIEEVIERTPDTNFNENWSQKGSHVGGENFTFFVVFWSWRP